MIQDRAELYKRLEMARDSKLIVYVTGDRQGLETVIASEVLDFLTYHLDIIGNVERISLYLYTRGGQTLAAWSIANLIRQYCNHFEVIVPSKAHSAGTLICLGAEKVVMTQQATLGPIDPSVNTPLNPGIPGGPPNARYSVSVEAINGFIELAKQTGVEDSHDLAAVLGHLTQHVHPLVLGEVFRTRSQIKMLGERLLSRHMDDKEKIRRILAFLCSESGSHDYTIYPREARDELGLPVEVPDDMQYTIIRDLLGDITRELHLGEPYNPAIFLGQRSAAGYEFTRALIESTAGGSHQFVSQGQVDRVQPSGVDGADQTIKDIRSFEGWRHVSAN